MRYPADQGARLSGTGARDNQKRTISMRGGRCLFRVQIPKKILRLLQLASAVACRIKPRLH
jgi:hypothetical protein